MDGELIIDAMHNLDETGYSGGDADGTVILATTAACIWRTTATCRWSVNQGSAPAV